jgi:hypothetical protein
LETGNRFRHSGLHNSPEKLGAATNAVEMRKRLKKRKR